VLRFGIESATAKTGDEFAMFTAGGRRLIVRGNNRGVPIGKAEALVLKDYGFRWSAHTQPGVGSGVLLPSEADLFILEQFGGQRSAILNSVGGRKLFTPEGTSLEGYLPE
jgi:hypothetical protein